MSAPPHEALNVRARQLFLQALDLPEAERASWLASACNGDPLLETELRSLLDFHGEPAGVFETSLRNAMEARWIGRQVGAFRIERLLGRGGAALVFEALQDQPRRRVALKLLRLEHLDAAHLRRFELEGELIGELRHPGIAKVFQAGAIETEYGLQPYLALELIEGEPLTRHAAETGASLAERVELVARVGDALQHAHEQGIVHRDVKPENILVDEHGNPRVLDFGVARVLNASLDQGAPGTLVGQVIGTVSYMSPEQAAGDTLRVDARSDVYSLGVVLYELIGGGLPHETREVGLVDAIRSICEKPARPLREVAPSVPRDLQTIVDQSLARDPDRRYRTAAAFVDDLRRFLAARPIDARPSTAWYRLSTFTRRNPVLVGALSSVLLLLVVGIVVTSLGRLRERELRGLEQAARATAEAERASYARQLYVSTLTAAESAIRQHNVVEAEARLAGVPFHEPGWEWTHFRKRLDHSDVVGLVPGWLLQIVSTPAAVVVGNSRGELQAFRPGTYEPLWTVSATSQHEVRALAADASGERIASGSGRWTGGQVRRGTIRLWSAADGAELGAPLEAHDDSVQALAFHPLADQLVSGSSDRTLRVWDLAEGREVARLTEHEHEVHALAFSPDGRELASTGRDGSVRIWDSETWELRQLLALPDKIQNALAWSPSGSHLAVGAQNGRIRILDRTSGELVRTLDGHTGRIDSLRYGDSDGELFSASIDSTVRSWNPETGLENGVFLGNTGSVYDLALVGDDTLVTGGRDGRLRRWSRATEDVRTLRDHVSWVYSVDVSPDDRWLASVSQGRHYNLPGPEGDGRSFVLVHDLETGRLAQRLVGHGSRVIWSVRFAPDSRQLLSVGSQEGAIVWDVATGERVLELEHPDGLRAGVYAPDGKTLATSGRDGRVRVFDAVSGALLQSLEREGEVPYALAFDPSGRFLVATYYSGAVARWNPHAGTLDVWQDRVHDGAVYCALFDPGGHQLFTAGRGGDVRRLDAQRLVSLGTPLMHSKTVYGLAWNPDGTRLASSDENGIVRLWDTQLWEEMASITAHETGAARCLDFSQDGRYLVTGGADRTVRILDGGSPAERLVDRRMGRLGVADLVLEELDREDLDPGLAGEVRQLVEQRRLSTDQLTGASWEMVKLPGLRLDEYEHALRCAGVARERDDADDLARLTFGAALLRAGRPDEAAAHLDPLAVGEELEPWRVCFLALAQLASGETRRARTAIEGWDDPAEDPLLEELRREARRLIADPDDGP